MTVAGQRPQRGSRLQWAWAGAMGGAAGGGAAALLCLPLIWELAAANTEDLALVWPMIDAAFTCLSSLVGASIGVLPWLASRARLCAAGAARSVPTLGEAGGFLLGCAVAPAAAALAGTAAGWIAGAAAAGATAGALAEALTRLLVHRPTPRSQEIHPAPPSGSLVAARPGGASLLSARPDLP